MFLCHTNSIKNNEVVPLQQYNYERVLTKINNSYHMLSNVCPHQKSKIIKNYSKDKLKCQYHGWEFDIHGNPISAGNTEHYCKNSDSLKTFPVFEWSNLLFSTEINFSESIDLSHLILVESRVDTVNSNIKNIMNIFLDVDHIPVLHTGVYESVGFDTVTVDTVKWSFYKNGSVQTVKENALWAAIYPNTMVEWQGGAVFITVAVEKNINESKVLVYKYRNLNMSDYEWHINESAWETAWAQDKMQAENIIGNTTTSRLELAKQHYAEWLEQGN